MHILHVVGARPNFMKAAPMLRALAAKSGIRQTLVHTGQHYDRAMSDVFFHELEMPEPDCNLEVGSGSHAQQTAAILSAFEPVVLERKPDLVLVYGDVNSTVAAALVCSKLGVRVGHVEAGLRSRDRTMPEEINRLLTDQLSDLLFTPSADGDENLLREGVDKSRIHLVGNVMIDTLVRLLPRAEQRRRENIEPPYVLVTLHRPSNVDDLSWLRDLLATLAELSQQMTVVFPVHPRTRQRLADLAPDWGAHPRLQLLDPLPYLDFLALQRYASFVITDSGGIQEETTFLGVPCLTVRENTERPVTITMGTNQLVGRDLQQLRAAVARILNGGSQTSAGRTRTPSQIPLWDGHAADRIAETLTRRGTS
ncbi:MAG TPA: UDP-N-acetylglucosamine 2-epimerase (non-hydrolyzing) [Candidatus Sulfotelmatobacter sp.]|nr:UDP-N-acetylglucosamine 2-epimerase (non-hydrolyzing) [Candidatus Sulfotelmatobacter sp.]